MTAALLGAALASSACQTEPDRTEPAVRYIDVQVSLGQADDEGNDTRSMVDIGVENFQKAALFAFDAETGTLLVRPSESHPDQMVPVVVFPTKKNFSWSLPIGRKMDIYAIVNYGDLDMESYAREGLHKSSLEALYFTSAGPSELKQLETSGYGMPMAGIRKGVELSASGQGLDITVKKLYAKYNLYFDLSRIEAEGWQVQAMHMIVENANTEVPYFIEGYRQDDPDKLVEYDRATEQDLDQIQQGGNGHAVTLYMLENCQGHKEGAESWKTVYKDLGFEAVRNCTYIDLSVKLRRPGGEFQNLGYAIYLGKTDMRSDFDIQRNLFKTIKIVLPGPDDPNPASHFFKFSGTDSPTVMPGESLDLYYVTNLDEGEIAVSVQPEGRLTVLGTTYQADANGIATGSVRLLANADLSEGETCLVTAGSETKQATDQRTVTASWPTVLEVDLSEAPAYVAQTGYLRVIPVTGVVRVDAQVKAGSEGILEIRDAGVGGSMMNIGLAGLSAGTGTVLLHHYNAAGVETGSQEVEVTIQAPLLRFSAEEYDLSPDGTEQNGMVMYRQADGSAFSSTQLGRFELNLIKQLLFPTDWIWVQGCSDYVEASFTRMSDDDLRRLCVPVRLRVKRLYSHGQEVDWKQGGIIGQVSYEGAPSANIPHAEADLALVNPFASLTGTCLGVIENNLPVYEALQSVPEYLEARGIQASKALEFTTYRNGKTFNINDSRLLLELEIPVSIDLPVLLSGPEEFTISCQGNVLTISAVEYPASYTGHGRCPLYAQIIHPESGERSSQVEMGYLEIYLIGAVGPYIHRDGTSYQVGGVLVPSGNRSPLAALSAQETLIRENVSQTSLSGYYLTETGSSYNLYHQSVEIDDNGIDRYARFGETSYLNSYRILTGSFATGTDVMEFRFGSIFQGHGCGIVTAALECDRMLEAWFRQSYQTGSVRHFPAAEEKDAAGRSYCAIVNLFGGNGGSAYDIFLEIRD